MKEQQVYSELTNLLLHHIKDLRDNIHGIHRLRQLNRASSKDLELGIIIVVESVSAYFC